MSTGMGAATGAVIGATAGRWRWRRLLDAPHRLCFFAGALLFAASGSWWALVLLAASAGVGLPWHLPRGLTHGLLMSGGFVPMFLAGFLFTAGPRWLQVPAAPARHLGLPVVLHLAGWGLFMAGAHAGVALAAVGLALAGTAWAAVSGRFALLLHRSRVRDTLHGRLLLAACSLGAAGLGATAAALAAGRFDLARAALQAGVWAANALAFLTAIHRMLPFFGDEPGSPWPAHGPLWVLVAALVAQALLGIADALGVQLPSALWALQALGETLVAMMLFVFARRSWRRPTPGLRMVAMLHVGFVWLGLAFALGAASHAMRAWSGHAVASFASLHALAAGFMGSSVFAMVARVSAGHAGRAVAADGWLWRLFWLLQLAIVGRVVAAIASDGSGPLVIASALAWAAAVTAWSVRHGRQYGLDRGRVG